MGSNDLLIAKSQWKHWEILGNSSFRFPAEYQEVEYLESHGTEYIDTGYYPNENFGISMDIDVQSDFNPSTYGALYGSAKYTTAWQYKTYLNTYGRGGTIAFIKSNYNDLRLTKGRKKYEFHNGSFYVNDIIQYTFEVNAFTSDLSLSLLSQHQNYNNVITYSTPLKSKLYSAKIYNNSTLVRDFVPCYRKADSVAGLYDLVNGVFYTNAGTGTFGVGANTGGILDTTAPLEFANNDETKTFNYSRTEKVELSTLNWIKETYTANEKECVRFKAQVSGIALLETASVLGNIFCSKYINDTANNTYYNTTDKTISLDTNSFVDIYDESYREKTANELKQDLSGTYLYYEPATPLKLRSCGAIQDILHNASGKVERKVGTRAYQNGDENDSSVLTDGITTNYPLATPTTEQHADFMLSRKITKCNDGEVEIK